MDDGSLEVWTHVQAIEGRANDEVCSLVAAFLSLPPSSIRVLRGVRSRLKLLEVKKAP